MKKLFKFFAVAAAAGFVFASFTACYVYKSMGKLPVASDVSHFEKLPYYKEGHFISPKTLERYPERRSGGKGGMARHLFRSPHAPDFELPKVLLTKESFAQTPEKYAVYWLGHSSFILELDGIRFVFDPVLQNAAPVWFAARRYDKSPIKRKNLPHINYAVLTHDHYDHLEYRTIKYLKNSDTEFIVPLGVGAHLKSWGIPKERIHELGWGDSFNAGNITITAQKAIHYSGRKRKDRGKSLWVSYIIKSEKKNIFVSGDSGYGDIFKEIGKNYGPFDLAFIEIDGWNPGWPNTHMFPNEVIQTMKDIKASLLLPTHWAVFDLALHQWDESIKLVSDLAEKENINLLTPIMGQKVEPEITETEKWWDNKKQSEKTSNK
ncbi:MAG: MBL fold metallo-hydrolase [Endomicrobium sp.]|jgi:L-ascorbate metabolism protein UlaG (beta-lactamase superfamily)|nr:MBL fold metallo-hydrolase [Endomicrobium sp.]